jgi:hypothetical protein
MNFKSRIFLFISILAICFSGCYSFKGISIPKDFNTFTVIDFVNVEPDAPLDIEITFSEKLRAKIRNESKLRQTDTDPDIQFEGEVNTFRVDAEAPKEGNTVDLNKLIIGVKVTYINNKNEEDTWSKSFSNFRTFSSASDLIDVQDDLIDEIFDQITESVFNEAFTDW